MQQIMITWAVAVHAALSFFFFFGNYREPGCTKLSWLYITNNNIEPGELSEESDAKYINGQKYQEDASEGFLNFLRAQVVQLEVVEIIIKPY